MEELDQILYKFIPKPGSFPCRLCILNFDKPEDLGYHFIHSHNLNHCMAQSEVAAIQQDIAIKLLNDGYKGYWIHDSFFITGRRIKCQKQSKLI